MEGNVLAAAAAAAVRDHGTRLEVRDRVLV